MLEERTTSPDAAQPDVEGSPKTSGVLGWLIAGTAVALSIYHFWSGYSGGLPAIQQRAVHVAGSAILLYLLAMSRIRAAGPAGLSTAKRLILVIPMAVIVAFTVYVFFQHEAILRATDTFSTPMLVWAAVVLLIALDLARRVIGWTLSALVVGLVGLVLLVSAVRLPGLSRFILPLDVADVVDTMAFSGTGLLGSITGVSAGVIASFLVFGGLLQVSGGSESFLTLARFAVGRLRGGPAKVSLVTSALFGTVSGSAVANVVVDGVFNIPLMKRSGFSRHYAAAVEASASMGGQITPPVMGAAAFIMAEFLGLPYSEVLLAAIVPIILFYVGLFIAIHVEALKSNLRPMPKAEIPRLSAMAGLQFVGSFVVPITVLIAMLYVWDRSLLFASWCASITIIGYILIFARMPFLERFRVILDGLRIGGIEIARIAGIVLAAQLTVCILGLSGIISTVTSTIARAELPLGVALLFLAGVVMLMGMGVPTSAAYVLSATVAGPIFFTLGVEPLAGHLFLLYLAVFSNVTPPVMPAIYAAASIARAGVWRSGFVAVKLVLPVTLIPFAFVLDPHMLINFGSLGESLLASGRMLLGILFFACGLACWLRRPLPLPIGVLLALGGAFIVWPGWLSTTIGTGVAALALLSTFVVRRAPVEAEPSVAPVAD